MTDDSKVFSTDQPDLFFENNSVGRLKKEIWEASDDEIDAVLAEYGVPSPVEWGKPGSYIQTTIRWQVEENRRKNDIVFVPIGCTELHGRHLPSASDTLYVSQILEGVRRFTAKRGAPTNLALPPLNYGSHPYHHMGMPGTIPVRENVARELLIDVMLGLWNDGFRKQIYINNHGHLWMLESAIQQFMKRYHLPGIFRVIDWHRAVREFFRVKEKGGPWDTNFVHADESETSLGLFFHPEMVDMDYAVDTEGKSYLPEGHFDKSVDPFGRPSRWSEGEGHFAIEIAATPEGVVGKATHGAADKAKRPVAAILRYLTLVNDEILDAFPAGTVPPVEEVTLRTAAEMAPYLREPLSEGWKPVYGLPRINGGKPRQKGRHLPPWLRAGGLDHEGEVSPKRGHCTALPWLRQTIHRRRSLSRANLSSPRSMSSSRVSRYRFPDPLGHVRAVGVHGGRDYRIRVQRIRCKVCGRTHSLLPDFLHPYRHYVIRLLQNVIHLYLIAGLGLGRLLRQMPEPGPARSTVREWIRSFAYGAGELLLDLLTRRLVALDPLADSLTAHHRNISSAFLTQSNAAAWRVPTVSGCWPSSSTPRSRSDSPGSTLQPRNSSPSCSIGCRDRPSHHGSFGLHACPPRPRHPSERPLVRPGSVTTPYVPTEPARSRTNQQSLALHRLPILSYTGTIQSQEAVHVQRRQTHRRSRSFATLSSCPCCVASTHPAASSSYVARSPPSTTTSHTLPGTRSAPPRWPAGNASTRRKALRVSSQSPARTAASPGCSLP